jgi:hypothetical protein
MKELSILCTTQELQNLFPTANLLYNDLIVKNKHHKLILNKDNIEFEVNHHLENIFEKIEGFQNFNNLLSFDSKYTNPIEDCIIIVDRKLWTEFYFKLMYEYPDIFKELEQIYVNKNITVLFNFAFLEAMDYENNLKYFTYDFKFKNIKMTDYELFATENNFYYDSFYCLFHLLSEGQLSPLLFPNINGGFSEYNSDFYDMFDNFNITQNLNKPYVYSNKALKPRFHRVQFLLKANEKNVLGIGHNCINEKFLQEYNQMVQEGKYTTDNTNTQTERHKELFTKEIFDKLNDIKNKITITPLNAPFEFNHLLYYFRDKEYNESYIEVVGETHCIFNLKYGFFTEKSIKPILSNKFILIFGSNKVYSEFERIGINLFLKEFGLEGIENKNELEQIDMIVQFLSKIDEAWIRKFFIENVKKLRQNRKIMIEYYCKIMNNINQILIDNAKELKTKII